METTKTKKCAYCQQLFWPRNKKGNRFSYCDFCLKKVKGLHKKGIKLKDFLDDRECAWCFKFFKPKSNRSKGCSKHCTMSFNDYRRRTGMEIRCSVLIICDCGNLVGSKFKKCSSCFLENRSKSMQRRLVAERQGDNGIHWSVVGERDDWVCHLCGGEVLKKAGTAYEPFGATVDHLIPIAKDGTHTWGNVALAHRRCNVVRGANELGVNYDES